MSGTSTTELRRELRLKLVLARGTELAKAYSRPEVQQRVLQCYAESAAGDPRLATARERFLETIADSYRVLRAGAGYAAMEYRTIGEHAEEIAVTTKLQGDDEASASPETVELLHPYCAALAGFVETQQRMLDRFVEIGRQRGVIRTISDPSLRDEITRAELPSADDYRGHVFGLLEGRSEVVERIAHALEAEDRVWRESAERMRDLVMGDAVAMREALRFDTESRVQRLYPS